MQMEIKRQSTNLFTASNKREAERAAAIWAANKTQQRPENITVKGAIDKYIAAKEPVLSPSTIDGYQKNATKRLQRY